MSITEGKIGIRHTMKFLFFSLYIYILKCIDFNLVDTMYCSWKVRSLSSLSFICIHVKKILFNSTDKMFFCITSSGLMFLRWCVIIKFNFLGHWMVKETWIPFVSIDRKIVKSTSETSSFSSFPLWTCLLRFSEMV